MTAYSVDSEAVLHATQVARSTAERIQADCAALQGQLSSLRSSWTGEASGAFAITADQWQAVQLQVTDSLTALSAALGTAGAHYQDAEAAATQLFR